MRKSWRRGAGSPADIATLTTEALRSLTLGDSTTFVHLVAALADRPATGHHLSTRLRQGITTACSRGWQPADVIRYTTRRRTPRHARLATAAIADEHPSVDGHEQREGADHPLYVRTALELIHLLENIPPLPHLPPGTSGDTHSSIAGASSRSGAATGTGGAGGAGAFGGSAGGGTRAERAREVDQRMLGKVRALLAKAESTEFPEEAEALSARAQELMARHSIDHALLAAETGDPGGPAGRRIAVDSPYEAPKAVLLTDVADANRCRAVWHRELGFSTVLGFPADLAAVEMLFTSLLVQATSAMVHAGPRRDGRGRSRTRSFRHAFLNAYAARIGERLREAAGEAADRAAADAGGKDLLPVLAARDRAVEQAVDAMFPNLAKGRAGSVSNYEGWVAGRAAADLASLNGRSEITGALRRP
jgi:hypothetical protein